MIVRDEINSKIKNVFPNQNFFAIPKIEKIVINVGVGKAVEDEKILDRISKDLQLITGQKPVVTRAKKAISGFKIRAGMGIGLMITLRGRRMWDFLDKLINITLPRIRDFRGVKKSSIQSGAVNIGIREHIVFPEIKPEKVEKTFGLQISIVSNAKSESDTKKLLSAYGMVFEK